MSSQDSPEVDMQEKVDNLPLSPGVYMFKDKKDRLLYVGKAKVAEPRAFLFPGFQRS